MHVNTQFKSLSPFFVVQEFVPKEIYKLYGDRSIRFIDPNIVVIANFVRERLGKAVTINNWHTGGSFNESGFRMPDTTTGAKLSSHKRGCAIDVRGAWKVQDLYKDIVDNYALYRAKGLTTVEDIAHTPTWVHLSCEWTGSNELVVVKP